jgi:hypothetical protein
MSDVIDDLANRALLAEVVALARGGPVPLAQLRRLAVGSAEATLVERHGAHWLDTLVDAAERGGIGHLRRDDRGAVALVPRNPVPTPEAAWERVAASWPPDPGP